MARGNPVIATADTTYQSIFSDATDSGAITRAGIEAAAGNSGRLQVRYTTGRGVSYLSLKAGDYKVFGGGKNQVTKIEIQGDASGQQYYFDALVTES